ncbi:OmpH family outer membrane protein [Flavobacterium sp.]|uniref:OmpH family outer membrane protein n=1 Tax=Flavobacterium sp. TaxID=239 RepID=UPI003753C775
MRRYILILFISIFFATNANAQSRGIKVGYIDMEYILEKVPDYAEAKNQLEQKAQKWKQEIEEKKLVIVKLKETLKSEKVLLTKELLDEREEEIAFLDTELLDYQQKRFGPSGDLMIQKAVLVKPIQDQVFNAVQDIAEAKKYDYVFDRSSDLTMLFAAKRHDISDQVVRVLTRIQNSEQRTKKQLEKEAVEERKQDMVDENPTLVARQKVLEEKRAARQKLIDERKIAADEKKKALEDKRKQLLEDKEAKKTGTVSDKDVKDGTNKEGNDVVPTDKEFEAAEKKAKAEEAKTKTLDERKKIIEDRKKALQDKKDKAIADREAAKKAREEEKKNKEAVTPKP